MKHDKQPYPFQATINRLLETVYGLTLTEEVKFFYSMSRRNAETRGWTNTCTYLKALYTQAQMMSLGLPPETFPFRKSDKQGFLRDLSPFKKYLQSDSPNHKRAALTVLRLAYLIYCEPLPSVQSITQGGGEESVKSMTRSFIAFARKRVPPVDPGGSIQVIPRAKSGPNGPQSLLWSHLDAVALTQRPQLLEALQELADLIDPLSRGSPKNKYQPSPPNLTEWVKSQAQWSESNSVSEQGRRYPVSRLAFIAEGGCKTRTIAIGDLFSQAVLLPLHDKLMKRLRSLGQDATFDQPKAIAWVKKNTQKGPMWSFDLTTATDRFPVVLQEIVMRAMFGRKVGSLWKKVMVSLRDFSFRDPRTSLTTEVYYHKGQGMGLYSSWPAFAYTHHIFVQWCASLEGEISFKDYRIIGDDVVIANGKVATRYRSMLEALDVPISKAKSIVSLCPPYSGEIAKRLVWKGMDISPIPPELIKQVEKHFTMLPALIDEIESRYGLDLPTLSALPSLATLYKPKGKQAKAAILLSAPVAFALSGTSSLYGKTTLEVTKELTAVDRAKVLGPWVTINPEVFSDIGWIQSQTRMVFTLREYEKVFKQWNFFNQEDGVVVPVEVPRACSDKGTIAINSQHPFYVASTWLECELEYLFQIRISVLDIEDEITYEDVGVRYCLDPTMRSYRPHKQEKSNTSSHLTLEVFKVLTGEKPMQQVEHPEDGLLVANVRFLAH